ncbi:MAG: hypothetical protein AB8B82_12910 [Roseovarius sp.]
MMTRLALGVGLYLLMVAAVVFIGVSKGGFDSGAAYVGASILTWGMGPALALAILLPVLLLTDLGKLIWGYLPLQIRTQLTGLCLPPSRGWALGLGRKHMPRYRHLPSLGNPISSWG